eukprot:m.155139 g.155139  ORF g.155139 m.155139 type:complete len:62 (+) comp16407_c0_seq6:144-329(+)
MIHNRSDGCFACHAGRGWAIKRKLALRLPLASGIRPQYSVAKEEDCFPKSKGVLTTCRLGG